MTDIHRRDTGSSLLDELLAERKRIHETWHARTPRASVAQLPNTCRLPPLPKQPEKPLAKRVAEAKKLRGQVSEAKLHFILNAIYRSARDRGEYVVEVNEAFRKSSPEITSPGELTIAKIQTVVAEHYNLTREEMLAVRRDKRVILPRHIAMYLSVILLPRTYDYIGERFGFDHASIIYAEKKIKRMIEADPVFAAGIERLSWMLGWMVAS